MSEETMMDAYAEGRGYNAAEREGDARRRAGNFQHGDAVYLDDGREAEYVIAVPNGGHVVRPTSDFGDDEPGTFDDPCFVSRVHAQPKTARIHAEIREAEAKLAKLREETSAAHGERLRLERESKAMIGRLSNRHAALKRIEDFLDGKITHAVTTDTYTGEDGTRVFVVPIAKALEVPDAYAHSSRQRDVKLVSLFGGSKGDLSWRVSYYSDGSGGSQNIHLFTSEEEARAFAVAMVERGFVKHTEPNGHLSALVESAKRLGCAIPAGVEERLRESVRVELAKQLETQEKTAAATRQKLESL